MHEPYKCVHNIISRVLFSHPDPQEEQSNMQSRCQDLLKQNELLHEQIQAMSGKMVTQLQQAAGDGTLNVSLSETEGKSQEQLFEILRFGICLISHISP